MEETNVLIRDYRFWLAAMCFVVLILMVLQSYPVAG